MGNAERAAQISCLVFDVDGTLTDGHIHMGAAGELFKSFDAKDGLAIRLAGALGYKTAIVTGRQSQIVEARARELAITAVYQGVMDKKAAIAEICQRFALQPCAIAYMGDDLNDLAAMQAVGLACAPRDAADAVKRVAHFVAAKEGGRGAAREAIEFILDTQGKWAAGVELLLNTKVK